MKRVLVILILGLAGLGCARGGDSSPPPDRGTVTFEKLIRELTDLDRLASKPSPSFEWRVESHPAGAAERTMTGENGEIEFVVAAVDGPGAIVQVWLAHPESAGTMRIRVDGADGGTRIIETPAAEWFSGTALPAIAPIAGKSVVGGVSWLPIPFAGKCMITTSAPPGEAQVIWRDYDDAARVETWSGGLSDDEERAIENAAAILSGKKQKPDENLEWTRDVKQWLPPGSNAGLSVFERGAVRRLRVRVEAEDVGRALADCRLEIRFDQHTTPTVSAPLADFYNVLPDRLGFDSLPIQLDGDGWMTCRWVMPYARRAELTIENRGQTGAGVEIQMSGGFRAWDEDVLYFHAGSQPADVPTTFRLDPFIDSLLPPRDTPVTENSGWWYSKVPETEGE